MLKENEKAVSPDFAEVCAIQALSVVSWLSQLTSGMRSCPDWILPFWNAQSVLPPILLK